MMQYKLLLLHLLQYFVLIRFLLLYSHCLLPYGVDSVSALGKLNTVKLNTTII